MRIKEVTAPASEPVTLNEAKLHCRVDTTADDAYITSLITAARIAAETYLNRALITRTLEYYMDQWPLCDRFEVPYPPLQSITSISYTDINGVTAAMDEADYSVDIVSVPGRVALKYGKAWPSVSLGILNPIAVRFVAGYGIATAIPAQIRQAILVKVGMLYDNRQEAVEGNLFETLLAPYRITYLKRWA